MIAIELILQKTVTTSVNVISVQYYKKKPSRCAMSFAQIIEWMLSNNFILPFARIPISEMSSSSSFVTFAISRENFSSVFRKRVRRELRHAGFENFRIDMSFSVDGDAIERERRREVPKVGRMRYVVGGKKTKRSLGGPPWNRVLLVFAAASSVPAGALGTRQSREGETVKSIQCFVLSDAKRV